MSTANKLRVLRVRLQRLPIRWLPPYDTVKDDRASSIALAPQTISGLKLVLGGTYKQFLRFSGTEDAPTFDCVLTKPDGTCAVGLRDLAERKSNARSKHNILAYLGRFETLLGDDLQFCVNEATRKQYLDKKVRLCEGLPEGGELDEAHAKAYEYIKMRRDLQAKARSKGKAKAAKTVKFAE